MDEQMQETEVSDHPSKMMAASRTTRRCRDPQTRKRSTVPSRIPRRCKKLLSENGWGGAWVNGVFSSSLSLKRSRGALRRRRFCEHRIRRT